VSRPVADTVPTKIVSVCDLTNGGIIEGLDRDEILPVKPYRIPATRAAVRKWQDFNVSSSTTSKVSPKTLSPARKKSRKISYTLEHSADLPEDPSALSHDKLQEELLALSSTILEKLATLPQKTPTEKEFDKDPLLQSNEI
jgi:hypothetical protein